MGKHAYLLVNIKTVLLFLGESNNPGQRYLYFFRDLGSPPALSKICISGQADSLYNVSVINPNHRWDIRHISPYIISQIIYQFEFPSPLKHSKAINNEEMFLHEHRIRSLLRRNFQVRTEWLNLERWHLTVLQAPSLSRQTWHKDTFAKTRVVPEEPLVFRDQSRGQHSYCQGSQDHWEENTSKMTFQQWGSWKELQFSMCDVTARAVQRCRGQRQWEKNLGGAKGCSPVTVHVSADSRLALDPTLYWEGLPKKHPCH